MPDLQDGGIGDVTAAGKVAGGGDPRMPAEPGRVPPVSPIASRSALWPKFGAISPDEMTDL